MEHTELVKKSKRGDGNAFSELIRHYEKDLYRVAIVIMKNDDDVLDCIQESILSAYKNLKGLTQDKFFRTWLVKILINKCNDSLRQKKRVIPIPEIKSGMEYWDNSDRLDVGTAVNSLEDELKILVMLYYYEDMSIKDIAESLKMPEGTVKSRLSRARVRLKEVLV